MAQNLGHTGKDFVARNSVLYVMPVAGGEEAAALTDEEHLDVSGPLEPSGPASVLVLNTALGSVELLDVTAEGGITPPLVHGARVVVGGATVAANGGEIAVSFSDSSTVGDVASLERGGEIRLLTDFSAVLRNNSRVTEPLDFDAESTDGHPPFMVGSSCLMAQAHTRSCSPSMAAPLLPVHRRILR